MIPSSDPTLVPEPIVHVHSDIYVPLEEVHIVCNPDQFDYIKDFMAFHFGVVLEHSTEHNLALRVYPREEN
jgi:hypothetical protein